MESDASGDVACFAGCDGRGVYHAWSAADRADADIGVKELVPIVLWLRHHAESYRGVTLVLATDNQSNVFNINKMGYNDHRAVRAGGRVQHRRGGTVGAPRAERACWHDL